jgi:hypothetical protein
MILGAPLLHYNYLCQKLKTLRKASVIMELLNCGTHYLQICVNVINFVRNCFVVICSLETV